MRQAPYNTARYFIENGGLATLTDLISQLPPQELVNVAVGKKQLLYVTCEKTRLYPKAQFAPCVAELLREKSGQNLTCEDLVTLVERKKELEKL